MFPKKIWSLVNVDSFCCKQNSPAFPVFFGSEVIKIIPPIGKSFEFGLVSPPIGDLFLFEQDRHG